MSELRIPPREAHRSEAQSVRASRTRRVPLGHTLLWAIPLSLLMWAGIIAGLGWLILRMIGLMT